MVELMVVVVIIAISAAIVIPLATQQVRDQQVHRLAKDVAAMYRNSRMLAMSRGGAVMVRYDTGVVTVHEGILDTEAKDAACAQLPVVSCNRMGASMGWNTGDSGNEVIDAINANTFGGSGGPVSIRSASGAQVDVCFTPMGRTMSRSGSTTVRFGRMTGPLTLNVHRGNPDPIGLVRVVTVLPGGAARLSTARYP